MRVDFSTDPMRAYLQFWGVMQAIFIQQDAISELYRVIMGTKLNVLPGSHWAKLRDVRISALVIQLVAHLVYLRHNGPSWGGPLVTMTA